MLSSYYTYVPLELLTHEPAILLKNQARHELLAVGVISQYEYRFPHCFALIHFEMPKLRIISYRRV